MNAAAGIQKKKHANIFKGLNSSDKNFRLFSAYFRVNLDVFYPLSSSHCLYVFFRMCADCSQQERAVSVIKVAWRSFLHIFVAQFETRHSWQRTRLNQRSVVSLIDCLLWNTSQIISSQNNISVWQKWLFTSMKLKKQKRAAFHVRLWMCFFFFFPQPLSCSVSF